MTRKRFKKLLMSYGYSRDNAERMAKRPKVLGISYQTYWNDNMRYLPLISVYIKLNKLGRKLEKQRIQ